MSTFVALISSAGAACPYPVAILAEQGIDYSGYTFEADSFDSGDPAKSTDGQYDPTKAGDAGDVVSEHGITNSLPVGSAVIYGHLYTDSNNPLVLGTNGGVGTHAWLATNSGIEPGYVLDTPDFTFPDTSPPYSSGLPTGAGSVVVAPGVTNYYDHILFGGDYYAFDLRGSTIVLGEARLVMPEGLYLVGNDSITLTSGASLRLYSGGTNCVISGNGVFNQEGQARNFILYASPTVTNLALNLVSPFSGVIIAPDAVVGVQGAGYNVVDISGFLMVKSLRLLGNFRFHFDQRLTAAATLYANSRSGGSEPFQFEVVGFPGFGYAVQASTDLVSWASVATNMSPFTCTNGGEGGLNWCFYRALYSPLGGGLDRVSSEGRGKALHPR